VCRSNYDTNEGCHVAKNVVLPLENFNVWAGINLGLKIQKNFFLGCCFRDELFNVNVCKTIKKMKKIYQEAFIVQQFTTT
jgi:GTP:adenosylcobinamide-phosphate guanylyltransferase